MHRLAADCICSIYLNFNLFGNRYTFLFYNLTCLPAWRGTEETLTLKPWSLCTQDNRWCISEGHQFTVSLTGNRLIAGNWHKYESATYCSTTSSQHCITQTGTMYKRSSKKPLHDCYSRCRQNISIRSFNDRKSWQSLRWWDAEGRDEILCQDDLQQNQKECK
jgi:hypothetical protein